MITLAGLGVIEPLTRPAFVFKLGYKCIVVPSDACVGHKRSRRHGVMQHCAERKTRKTSTKQGAHAGVSSTGQASDQGLGSTGNAKRPLKVVRTAGTVHRERQDPTDRDERKLRCTKRGQPAHRTERGGCSELRVNPNLIMLRAAYRTLGRRLPTATAPPHRAMSTEHTSFAKANFSKSGEQTWRCRGGRLPAS